MVPARLGSIARATPENRYDFNSMAAEHAPLRPCASQVPLGGRVGGGAVRGAGEHERDPVERVGAVGVVQGQVETLDHPSTVARLRYGRAVKPVTKPAPVYSILPWVTLPRSASERRALDIASGKNPDHESVTGWAQLLGLVAVVVLVAAQLLVG